METEVRHGDDREESRKEEREQEKGEEGEITHARTHFQNRILFSVITKNTM